ncbi:MAG TPA: acyltransferase [Polyangiaceae bacterium]|nr:acyltransferase [Polyangiaceae bacterium]
MTRKEALRLEYLDGLRAVAALYVVLFHAGLGFLDPGRPLVGFARNLQRALSFGHDAVAVFIVLSGYCLMLPVARAEGQLVRGIGNYIARRAWRILPPYFATVFGSLLLITAIPVLETPTKTIWADTFPAFEFGPIASHLLLIHNLSPAWSNRINGPLWSVATEWQIYFFFPFVLLPLWRRFGATVTVLSGFVLGGGFTFIAPSAATSAASWYLGLFALGMCAAGVDFSTRPAERWLRERVPWRWVNLGFLAAVACGTTLLIKHWFRFMPYSDALVGAATASGLLYLSPHALRHPSEKRHKPLALRVLSSGPLLLVGRFSYSLYLTHLPIVALCYFALRPLELSPNAEMLSLVLLSLPLSLLVAYAFFWVFERRFVGAPPAFFRLRRS